MNHSPPELFSFYGDQRHVQNYMCRDHSEA